MVKNLYFTKEHEQIRRAVRDFIKKEINPYEEEWEAAEHIPLHDILKKMGDLGFLGITYDTKWGGEGLDLWSELAFLEETGYMNVGSVNMAITVHTHMATPAIHESGSDYLKETYLRPSISGDLVSAIAVTEPDAGSDVSALKTYAKKDGDKYIINGSKTFITNGTQADFVTLLARTSDDPGYRCFSLFVVPTDLPGFHISRKLDKMGFRGSDTAELFFDDLRLPAENLIGVEGEGFIYQMKQFVHERFSNVVPTYTGLKSMIDRTVEYIKKRVVFGEPLINKQVLQHRIAQWLVELECLKRLCYHITMMRCEGMDATNEVTMAKIKAGQLSNEVTRECLRMHGGSGYMSEMPISRNFRDGALNSIGGGATEVMLDYLARRIILKR